MPKLGLARPIQENGGVQSLHPWGAIPPVRVPASLFLRVYDDEWACMPKLGLAHSIQVNGGVQSLHPLGVIQKIVTLL